MIHRNGAVHQLSDTGRERRVLGIAHGGVIRGKISGAGGHEEDDEGATSCHMSPRDGCIAKGFHFQRLFVA